MQYRYLQVSQYCLQVCNQEMHTVYTDQFGAGQHVVKMYQFLRNQPPKIKKRQNKPNQNKQNPNLLCLQSAELGFINLFYCSSQTDSSLKGIGVSEVECREMFIKGYIMHTLAKVTLR